MAHLHVAFKRSFFFFLSFPLFYIQCCAYVAIFLVHLSRIWHLYLQQIWIYCIIAILLHKLCSMIIKMEQRMQYAVQCHFYPNSVVRLGTVHFDIILELTFTWPWPIYIQVHRMELPQRWRCEMGDAQFFRPIVGGASARPTFLVPSTYLHHLVVPLRHPQPLSWFPKWGPYRPSLLCEGGSSGCFPHEH